MNKSIILLLLLVIISVVLLSQSSRTHYGISEGCYYMVSEEDQPLTYIGFSMEEKTVRFVLGADNISFSHYGEVILDGRVNAIGENGGVWVFDVVDNETIKFCKTESSGDPPNFQDGALFKYKDVE